MIHLTCGQCGRQFTVDDRFAGQRGRCSGCGRMIEVPAAGPSADIDDPLRELATAAAEAASHRHAKAQSRTTVKPAREAPPDEGRPVEAPGAAGSDASSPPARQSAPQRAGSSAPPSPPSPPSGESAARGGSASGAGVGAAHRQVTYAVFSLALGIAALLVIWIPWVNLLSLTLSVIGLVVGLAALILAFMRRSGFALASAGAGLSFAVLIATGFLVNSYLAGGMAAITGLSGGSGQGVYSGGGGNGDLIGLLDGDLLTPLEEATGSSAASRQRIRRIEPDPARRQPEAATGPSPRATEPLVLRPSRGQAADRPDSRPDDSAGPLLSDAAADEPTPQPQRLQRLQGEDDAGDAEDESSESSVRPSGAGNEPSDAAPWTPASQTVRYGPLQVGVESARVDRVMVDDLLAGRQRTREPVLAITLRLANYSQDGQIVDYLTWMGPGIALTRQMAVEDLVRVLDSVRAGSQPGADIRLHDDRGNRYERHIVASTEYLLGGGGGNVRSIRPGESIRDTLLFKRPVSGIKRLRLELPARHFGGTGAIRFQIPADMIEGL